MNYFVDTNYFLRFLLADQKAQFKKAEQLFKKAERGEIKLWTTDVVILEIIWTLHSFYKLKSPIIVEKIRQLLVLPGVKFLNKDEILKALDLFIEKEVDFVDAYNFVLGKKAKVAGFISFDKDFQKLTK